LEYCHRSLGLLPLVQIWRAVSGVTKVTDASRYACEIRQCGPEEAPSPEPPSNGSHVAPVEASNLRRGFSY
jgi:hypothetical protein